MKKLIALLLTIVMVGVMAAGFAGCGEEEDDGFKVAIVLAEYNEWNKNYEKKVIEKCNAWGWTNQGFDAMTIQAVDMAALAPVVKEAAEAGVIVVDHYGFTEEQVPGNLIYQNLFDQKGAGKLQAEEFIKINGESGKVAIIAGLTGASNAMARTEGFMEVLNKYPGIEVVATEYCDWDTQKAQTAAENILTANPDLAAFLVQDDGMSKGVWNAIEAAGKQETCKIASQGFYGYSIDYIESDKFMFTIAYPAGNFSIAAMDMIKNHVDGVEQDRISYVGMSLVTKENCRTTDHD